MLRATRLALTVAASVACIGGVCPPRADASDLLKPVCTAGGLISGLVGKACTVVEHGGRLISAGKKLASGHLGSAVKTAFGSGGSSVGAKATFALGLAAVVTWVVGGAKYALNATLSVIGHTSSPQLRSTWFSATYWRVAGIAALLTLPFLFAAAVQALIQSDLSMLARAALGYLPLAMLAVSIAAPVAMLLLSASDELAAIVSSAAGDASGHFLSRAVQGIGGLVLLARSPFLVFFVGLLTVAGAIVLWLELLVRAAAVYVIVLLLPLAFAALVWPARRIWAIRAVEVLIALILSKFVIVAVLSLGGAALSANSLTSLTGLLAGFVLLTLGALAPWALLRLVPLGELASGAVGSWRGQAVAAARNPFATARDGGLRGHEWGATTAEMRRQAEDVARAGHDAGAGAPLERAPETLVGTEPASSDDDATSSSDDELAAPEASETAATGAVRPAGNGRAAVTDASQATERSPGLHPIWQQEDESWPVLTLGLDDGWPPPPIADTPAGRPDAAADPAAPPASAHSDGSVHPEAGGPAATGHEVHDPTPPPQPQPPDEGSA